MSDFLRLVQTFGLAVALLAVNGVALWRVALWLKPWAERMLEAHLGLVDRANSMIGKTAESVDLLHANLVDMATTQRGIMEQMASLSKTQGSVRRILDAQSEAIRRHDEAVERRVREARGGG